MDAREFFCSVRDALNRLDDMDRTAEAKLELAVMRGRRDGPSGRGGVTDPSRRWDDLAQYEQECGRKHASDMALVAEAKKVVVGLAGIYPVGASVLLLRYIERNMWREVETKLALTHDRARQIESTAFDIIDSNGFGAVKAGNAVITGAE